MTPIEPGVCVRYLKCHKKRTSEGVVKRVEGDIIHILGSDGFHTITREAVRKVYRPGSKGVCHA